MKTGLKWSMASLKKSCLGACLTLGVLGGAQHALAAEILGLESLSRVPGEYIVVLKSDSFTFDPKNALASQEVRYAVEDYSSQIKTIPGVKVADQFSAAIAAVVVSATDEGLKELASDDRVAYIEANQTVSTSAVQYGATWGIDRIDSRYGTDNNYTYNYTASGVHAYVIDTGINTSHSEFSGRIGAGYSSIGGSPSDCNGHGTHVAGTIGGSTYGVAKGVILHPVRVLDCNGGGTISSVLSGINWVASNYIAPAVANMSLGGGASSSLDQAVNNAVDSGVAMIVAAGNSSANACNYSPARASKAITVGATTSSDTRAYYSNYGSCLNVFAPGSGITSAWTGSSYATNTISGTSMASPHVAGVAALLAGQGVPAQWISGVIAQNATYGAISDIGSGSTSAFLFSTF